MSITVGKVAAGAAVAAGAVLVLAAAGVSGEETYKQLANFFTETLPRWFGSGTPAVTDNADKILGMSKTTAAIVGAATMGGGLMLNQSLNEQQEEAALQPAAAAAPVRNGYAERIAYEEISQRWRDAMFSQAPDFMNGRDRG